MTCARRSIVRACSWSRHARAYFARIEPELYRFPAIDPAAFRRAVEGAFGAGD